MRIGFDFDGVLCLTPFGRFAVHAPGHVDPLPRDYERFYDPPDPASPARVAIEYLRYAWRQSPPEATHVLRDLASKHDLYIVTGRSEVGMGILRRWLRRHGIEDFFRDVRMGPPGLRPAQHKLATARMIGIDVHIDDDPKTAYHLAANGVRAFLLDHAGARGDEPPPHGLTIVRSLDEFGSLVAGET